MNNVLPKRFNRPSIFSLLLYIALVYLIVESFSGAGFNSNLEAETIYNNLKDFIGGLFPLSFDRIGRWGEEIWITLQMAITGTFIGVVFSLPFAVLASNNFAPNKLVYYLSRGFISFFRTVPDLIWAIFFVITVGLGPLAGTLALAIDTIGFCGRFFAEAIEETDKQPIQGLEALGASKTSTIFCAVLPAVLPSFTNTSLFSLEKAVRSSVVIGLVGAGGIGNEIKVSMEMLRYQEVASILILIIMIVLIVERLSSYIRAKII